MSTEDFKLDAKAREDAGKGASRRLRRLEGAVPAIVYGGDKDPQMVSVIHKDLIKHLDHEAFYSHVITLNIGKESENVILKDLQRHPAKEEILHVDFLRVLKDQKLTMNVPLHFINEDKSPGVKLGGGKVSHTMTQLEVSCLPVNIPEYIEVDLAEAQVGDIIHISDLKLPEGVESVALAHGSDHDLPIASVNKPKGSAEEIDGDETEDEEEDS